MDFNQVVEDYWSSDKQFPVEDWQYEVTNDYTRRGYWEWVASKREQMKDEEE